MVLVAALPVLAAADAALKGTFLYYYDVMIPASFACTSAWPPIGWRAVSSRSHRRSPTPSARLG